MNLKTVPWIECEKAKDRIRIALVPIGAIEAYGPHSPLGTDGIAVEETAKLLAERVSAFVTPLIPVGCSRVFEDYPGCLSVRPTALRGYLAGVVESLIRLGCDKILFVNGHAGNVGPIVELMEVLKDKHPDVNFAQIDFWRFVEPVAKRLFKDTENPLGHAGETTTSVMLYLALETIQLQNVKLPVPTVKQHSLPGVTMPRRLSPKDDRAVSGDPLASTAERGKEIIDYALNSLIQFLASWTKKE